MENHTHKQTVHTVSFCEPDEKFALFLTHNAGVCVTLKKCFAALIDFDVFSRNW